MPTRPLDQGCSAAQATVSAPSGPSLTSGSKRPSEPQRPRMSCESTAYPWAAYQLGWAYR